MHAGSDKEGSRRKAIARRIFNLILRVTYLPDGEINKYTQIRTRDCNVFVQDFVDMAVEDQEYYILIA